jgi:UDP-N-acetylglucosamine 3-dehydrogenase
MTKNPDAPLTLALLGCGNATTMHSRTLRKVDPTVRRAYASRDPERARAFAAKYGGAAAYGSYEAAIGDPAVDAVLIATPPASHLELTLAALEAGKHVIVEKPPFLRAADFDTVRAARDRAGRRVMVAENYYYKPLAEALRQVIASGDLGEIRILSVNALKHQAVSGWRDEAALSGGGALYEGGIHWVNFMTHLGLPVEGVDGFRPGGVDEHPDRTMVLVFRYAHGAVGTLYYSWEIGSPMKGLRLSALYGTEGTATFESNGIFLAVRGRRRRLRFPGLDVAGYAGMFRDFLGALRANAEPRFDFDAAHRDLQLVEAAYRSLDRDGGSAPSSTPTEP